MSSLRSFLSAAVLAAIPIQVFAATGGGFYLAAGLGDADVDDDTAGLQVDDSDTGFHGVLGFDLLPHLSIEAGYLDFGELGGVAPGLGVATQAEIDGFVLGGRGYYEFADHWFIQGRLGAFLWDVEAEAVSGGSAIRVNDDGSDLYYGLGVRWDFHDSWGVSADWTRYQTDDLDVDYLSASLIWRFDL